MEKKLYIKILEFLNDQEDILKYCNLKNVVAKHYFNLYRDKSVDGQILSSEISKVINDLENRNFIKLEKSHRTTVEENSKLSNDSFKSFDVSCIITIDGINYLQSEQDAQTQRDFIVSQKEFINFQHSTKWYPLVLSIISVIVVAVSLYKQLTDKSIETQLHKIGLELEKLNKLKDKNQQKELPFPVKKTSLTDSITRNSLP